MSKNTTKDDSAYRDYISVCNVKSSRNICLVGSILFFIFIPIDMILYSTSLYDAALQRAMPILVLLSGFVLSFQNFFTKYYEYIFSAVFLAVAISIITSVYKHHVSDYSDSYSKYHLATMLVYIMCIFTWSYFRLKTSSLLVLQITLAYAYTEYQLGVTMGDVITSSTFLLTASTIGYFSQMVRDNYLKQNFLLHQSLESSLKEKTIEAKDNAYLANHDALTSLPNRRYATELLEKSLEVAKQEDKCLIIIFVDLNGFKPINDIHGHAVGDIVLLTVARRFEMALHKSDTLARLGGDEYLIGLLVNKDNLSMLDTVTENFGSIISEKMIINEIELEVSASFGIATYPFDGSNIDALIDIADKKMYEDKYNQPSRIEREG